MRLLSDNEWEYINAIILMINSTDDSRLMRKSLLIMLRRLIVYNIAEFSIGQEDYSFCDSVEVNMDNDQQIHFLDKYFAYKKEYGNINIDWIFRNPSSIVMRVEDILRGEVFENTNFNKVYLKSINMKHCCTTSLATDGVFLGEFSLYLADGYGVFSDRDIYILEQLKDHLANKLMVYKKRGRPLKLSEEQYSHLQRHSLTNKEIEIFECILNGKSNEDIANELFISTFTVKKHVSNIFYKLSLKSRNQIKTFF